MPDGQACNPHPAITGFRQEFRFLKPSLLSQRKIKIVAIGSSSVAGEGDIMPFPPRLELALRKRYPDRMIDVINRGIGGQEAPEEAARLESDVIAEAPTLVIWQVGSNAIFHRDLYDPGRVAGTIATALSWLGTLQMDIILMDLQYAPALLGQKEHDTRLMVSLIAEVARTTKVNLFRRFELMEHWVKSDGIDQSKLIGPDGLHQTDFATNCVTQALDAAIGVKIGPVPGAPVPTV
jgi:acyl-CoA thioesterase I